MKRSWLDELAGGGRAVLPKGQAEVLAHSRAVATAAKRTSGLRLQGAPRLNVPMGERDTGQQPAGVRQALLTAI